MFNYRNQKLINLSGHALRLEYCSLITHIFDIYVVHFKMCNRFSSFEEITESKNRGGFRGLLENSIATSPLRVLFGFLLIISHTSHLFACLLMFNRMMSFVLKEPLC